MKKKEIIAAQVIQKKAMMTKIINQITEKDQHQMIVQKTMKDIVDKNISVRKQIDEEDEINYGKKRKDSLREDISDINSMINKGKKQEKT
jgi:hypothetical protein